MRFHTLLNLWQHRGILNENNFLLFSATAGEPVCNIFQRASCQLSQDGPSARGASATGSRFWASFASPASGQPSAQQQCAACSSQHCGWRWIQILHRQPICWQRRRYRWDPKFNYSVLLKMHWLNISTHLLNKLNILKLLH